MLKSKKPILYILSFIFLVLVIYFLGLRMTKEEVIRIVQEAGIWGPLVFIFLTLMTSVIAPISNLPLWLGGYALFGNWVQIYTDVAFVLGSAVNFLIARRFGRMVVIKLVGGKNMTKVDTFTQDYGFKTLIFLRIFQGNISDFISYAYGLTNMKFIPYLLVTILAPIPWILLWQFYLFDKVNSYYDFVFLTVVTLLPLLIISVLLVLKFGRRKKESSER
ncbi:MAG: VTT domain-containing protein [bacterium]|nr:VTT domain-containing protein [bacterium]